MILSYMDFTNFRQNSLSKLFQFSPKWQFIDLLWLIDLSHESLKKILP